VNIARRFLFVALGITAIAGAANAQMAGQNLPMGSPLDSTTQSATSDSMSSASPSAAIGQSIVVPGPSQILEPKSISDEKGTVLTTDQLTSPMRQGRAATGELWKAPPKPGEFENYVAKVLGRKLPRFGEDLLLPSVRDFATPSTASVPPDYIINPGDTITISLAGSLEGSVEREVDTNGNIFLPNVGAVHVAGIRFGDLQDTISKAIGRQYRGYTVGVRISKLRGIRVYVTGFANNPGAFTVSSLSTLTNAVLQAGGPSSGGSFRSVKLYRNGREVADYDLYQLLRGGNRVNDAVLQNEDVLFIPPAGEQVAVFGSVQEEAIYEAKPGESINDVLAAAGGPNALGDKSRVILYRTTDAERVGPQQISTAVAGDVPVRGGDLLQVLSKGSLVQPIDRQSVLVRVEGEVNRPGNYYIAPNTPLHTVMEMAGGLTPRAFVYGTKFTRQSVKLQQQENYKEAISQLELTLAAAPLTANTSQSESERASALSGARAVLDRLKNAQPDGRVVLNIAPNSTSLPDDVLLENNDSIYVPPMSTTVGVFGAVYRPASFNIGNARRPMKVKEYIDRAGGMLRAADRGGIFVVRASGDVISKKRGALDARVIPGDVIFVPVKTQTGGFWAKFKDITSTLFQLGLGAATVTAVVK
jgi:protein involved in polysaccharide export with SLBB domain